MIQSREYTMQILLTSIFDPFIGEENFDKFESFNSIWDLVEIIAVN